MKKKKRKRQLNLILKESNSKENSVRKDEDTCSATSILKDYLDVTVSITKINVCELVKNMMIPINHIY